MKKIVFLSLGLIYFLYLLTILGAHIYYRRSTEVREGKISLEEALSSINRAISLNPLNSAYRYQRYYLLRRKYENHRQPSLLDESIKSLQEAIALQPAQAKYHLHYALSLLRRYSLRDEEISHRVKRGLRRAVELKPFSRLYKEIYSRVSFKIERYHQKREKIDEGGEGGH